MRLRMRLKIGWATSALLLGLIHSSGAWSVSDLLKGSLVKMVEQQEVAKAADCILSADDALARAVDLLSDGRQAEAEDLIKSAVKSHRDDVRILFAKAVLERSRWHKDAADVWFAMARKAKGNEVLSRAAWLSMQLDQKRSTDENLEELIRLSDENPDNIFLLWLGAIQCREQTREGSNLETRPKKEVAELGRVRYELLFKHFKLGPVLAHHTYANILTEDLGDYDTALEHRIKAVSMTAKNWTLEGFADTLTKMGEYRWACPVWEQAIKMHTTDARCHNRWGDALFALGQYEDAAEKYREATRLRPKSKSYWKDLGDCLARLGKENRTEMFESYQQAVEFGNEWATKSLGWCYRYGHGVEQDNEKAFELYQRYRKVDAESAWILREMGIYYNSDEGKEKNPKKALECYEEAVAMKPDNWHGLNGLAYTLTLVEDPSLQNHPRAIKLAKRAASMDENDSTLGTLAAAYFKNGQHEEAVRTQEQVIAFWKSRRPEKLVPEKPLKKLEEYKAALEEVKETP